MNINCKITYHCLITVRRKFDTDSDGHHRLGGAYGFSLVKILTALFLVSGCTGVRHLAPVDTLQQPPSLKISTHIVAKGETLYSIAWRYTLDVNELARANGLLEPYKILPGQKLSIDLNQPRYSTRQSSTTGQPSVTTRSKIEPNSAPSKVRYASQNGALRWRWPVNGALLAEFGGDNGLNKGIDIGAKKGQPVLAAESGTVVYAGTGLRGYGKLLIIKHNDYFLSAYAHNDRLLAAEGESVKAGQKIAEIGSSGTDSNKLHFEIRLNGKPVDPLQYLPRR